MQVVEVSNQEKMLERCEQIANQSLREICKGDMIWVGATFAIPENAGLYSLGCCWVERPTLEIMTECEQHRLKLKWYEQNDHVAVGVADIRLYECDHRTLKMEAVLQLQLLLV